MVNKSLLIIFLFLLVNISYNILADEEYSITFFNNLKTSNYIIPVFNEDGVLYIVTGENKEENINDSIYIWNILQFNTNSGILFGNYSFDSSYPFDSAEVISIEDNLYHLFSTTTDGFQIFNENKLRQLNYKFYGSKRNIIKIGSYYYLPYIDFENNIMKINQIKIINNIDDSSSPIEIVKSSEPIQTLIYQSMISCDVSKDNKYILCLKTNIL